MAQKASQMFPALAGKKPMQFPPTLPDEGILVGWSMERVHRRDPIGFSYGDPATSPDQGFVDPILMEPEGHLITIAPTGAGKGVGCIIPALLRHQGPAIVVDPKGENTAITARHRRALGQKVVVLDPTNLTSEKGGSLNPLDLIDPETPGGVDEAVALVNALLPDSIDGDRNRFWVNRGRQLLTGILLHVVSDLPKKQHTLMRVREIVHEMTVNPEQVGQKLKKSRHPEVRLIEGALSIGARETLGGILAFAQEGIDFIRGPQLNACLGKTSFDLGDIVRGAPISLYIVMPPHMLHSHGRILRLWISTLIQLVLRRRSRPERSTLFLLDEAAQLGTLDELRTAITLLRGYGLQTWSFWQDVTQLKMLYPRDWQTMVNNSRAFQAFGANNMRAAEDMADLVGFISGKQFLDMEQGEMLLQIAGDEAVVARLPNYMSDPVFQGLFDANPFFDESVDPMPERVVLREYLRDVRKIAPRPEGGVAQTGRNPIDTLLAKRILEGVADRK